MGGTGCGGNWVLVWWAGMCSVKLEYTCLLMDGAVLPPPVSCLAWGDPVLESIGFCSRTTGDLQEGLECPCIRGRPVPVHASTGDPQHPQVGLTQCSVWVTPPFLWDLVCTRFCLCPPRISCFPQSYGSSVIKSHWPSKSDSLGIPSPLTRSPGWGAWCGA